MAELNMALFVLPFPPTLNHTKGIGRRKNGSAYVYSKDNLTAFKREAHGVFLQQKKAAGKPIKGHFTYHLVLDERRRTTAPDGDNRTKYVLDFLQSVGMIENDKLADGGSWSWGPCDPDMCIISIFQKGMQPA